MKNSDGPQAVLFDMGGTIEDVWVDSATYLSGAKSMAQRLYEEGITAKRLAPERIRELVENGLVDYKEWAMERGVESSPLDIWSKWLLKGEMTGPSALTAVVAEWLSLTYETVCLSRRLRPEAYPTLAGLKERGYILGVISNTISETQVAQTLGKHDLEKYFDTVQASVLAGSRKPDPTMLLQASKELSVSSEQCMYVGDNPSRDILGARNAGYGWALLITSPDSHKPRPELAKPSDPSVKAPWEAHITSLLEILELVDERPWSV